MGPTINELASTMVLGTFLLLGAALVLELCHPDIVLRYLRSDHIPKSVAYAFVASLALIAGMLVEDLSNLVVDNVDVLLSPFPSERGLRSRVLLNPSLRGRYGTNDRVLASLTRAKVDREQLDILRHPAPRVTSTTSVNDIYYVAKNNVFLEDNYYDELKAIQSRIDFARSFTLCCLVHCIVCAGALLTLFKPAHGLRRGQIVKRVAFAFAFFLSFYVAARFAYTSEEKEFNKRVFGYYLVLVNREKAEPAAGVDVLGQ